MRLVHIEILDSDMMYISRSNICSTAYLLTNLKKKKKKTLSSVNIFLKKG